jgi:uncharacterized protein
MSDLRTFHEFVKEGDLASVRTLLAQNPALLSQTNDAGQSAFLLAKYYGQESLAEYLLSLNPELDLFTACIAGRLPQVQNLVEGDRSLAEAHNPDGWTPLHLASFFGHPDLARFLVQSGAPVDVRSTNAMTNTPLHAAIAGRKAELVKLLLEAGADANAQQYGGWRALHGAAQNGDRSIVESLLAHGADAEARAENQQTALDLALLKGHGDIVSLLEELSPKSGS